MASQIIFSDKILFSEIQDKRLDNKIRELLNLEISKDNNNILSNEGGFQTNSIKDMYILNTLINASADLIKENYKFFKKTKIIIDSAWINKNDKNHYNNPHVHIGFNFAGVYYVDVPSNGGHLVFIRNDISSEMVQNDEFIEKEFDPRWHVYPKKNMLVLFPSNLLHFVKPHYEDNSRISLAFNIKFQHG